MGATPVSAVRGITSSVYELGRHLQTLHGWAATGDQFKAHVSELAEGLKIAQTAINNSDLSLYRAHNAGSELRKAQRMLEGEINPHISDDRFAELVRGRIVEAAHLVMSPTL